MLQGTPIGSAREAFLEPFEELREPTLFFASQFKSRRGNRFNTDEVTFDIRRHGQPVAVAVTPGSAADVAGPEFITASKYDNKRVRPANFNPGTTLTAADVNSRQFGENPFGNRDFRVALRSKMMSTVAQLDDMNVRAMERMAVQVLTTGKVESVNRQGQLVFEIDYGAKDSHFPVAGVPWSTSSSNIVSDLKGLAQEIKRDSGMHSDMVVCGTNVVDYILDNDQMKDRLNFRHAELVRVLNPAEMDRGATFHGYITAGAYKLELWSYDQTFDHEQTGDQTYYLDPDRLVMMNTRVRLDRLTSSPARPFGEDPSLAQFNPGRLQSSEFDVTPFLWTNARRTAIFIELAMRCLMVPTQVDGWGSLLTVAP